MKIVFFFLKNCRVKTDQEKSWWKKDFWLLLLSLIKRIYGKTKLTKSDSKFTHSFTFDHQTFYSLFKVGSRVIGCKNHDIAVGLCSEILMRLSYYINLGYVKKLPSHMGSKPRSFRTWAVYSTPRPWLVFRILAKS